MRICKCEVRYSARQYGNNCPICPSISRKSIKTCECGVKYSIKQYGNNCPLCPKYTNEVWEILDIPVGEILIDAFIDDTIRYMVMRGPSALCAYIGIPEDHPLAGFDYDDISLDCHGGLTFSSIGDGKLRPFDYYWYGWDYSHLGDAATYYYDKIYKDIFKHHLFGNDKKWTIQEVRDEAYEVANWDFKRLANLAEKISEKEKERHHLSVTQLFINAFFPSYFKWLYSKSK